MAYESGIRDARVEFIRETTRGTTPTNPDWLRYSDAVQNVTVTPTGSINPRGNIGSPDIANFNAGTESHEFSITYDLQRWPAAAGDPSYDGMHRIAQGELPAAHSFMMRAEAGDSGIDGGGSRIYYVATGALINTVTIGGEPESGEPVTVTLDYMCEKLRAYKIDQPASAQAITIESSDNSDDSQAFLIEDDDVSDTFSGTLDGTTPVSSGATTFSSIDTVTVDAETKGDVIIKVGSNEVMRIFGTDAYGGREGDLGVPNLGTGSHEGALGTAYESILGDTINRAYPTELGGTEFLGHDADISSVSATVENNVEASSTIRSIGQALSEGPRTVTLNATLFGPAASYDAMVDHLRAVEANIVWTLTGGTLTFNSAAMTSMGAVARETDQAVLTVDNTFQAQSLTIA